MQIVEMKNNQPTTNSKTVADMFEKAHRDILVKIRKTIKMSGDFGERNFTLSSYTSEQNKIMPCYEMTRDGFTMLAMELSGKKVFEWKLRFIEAFNAMEDELKRQSSGKSSMQLLNDAVKIMEHDKEIASASGKQLNSWKKQKKSHEESIKKLVDDAQLKLGFNI